MSARDIFNSRRRATLKKARIAVTAKIERSLPGGRNAIADFGQTFCRVGVFNINKQIIDG